MILAKPVLHEAKTADISFLQIEVSKIALKLSTMMFHLQYVSRDEDDHKIRCDVNKEMTTAFREKNEEKIKLFQNKVADSVAVIKVFIKAIYENKDKAADIIKFIDEDTVLRNDNIKDAIFDNIKDSQDAQAASAAITKSIKAITENNDKAADIIKYKDEEIELWKENHSEIFDIIKDSQDAQAVSQATQDFKEDKDEKIRMFMKKVTEYVAAIKKLIKAITVNNDKDADITKYIKPRTNWHCGSHF